MKKKRIVILGSTGSIGTQALKIVRRYPELFEIVGLVAGSNETLFNAQVEEFKPDNFALAKNKIDGAVRVASETECDLILNAIVGARGLEPTIAGIQAGRDIALANKETFVIGGALVKRAAKVAGVKILPIDSEHSAIWQATDFGYRLPEVKKIILTASGGAFRDVPLEKFSTLTARDALKHPTWHMGAKITIDCATMINKGFEIMEAMYFFDMPIENIEVVIHKESIIHSMVVMRDNSIIAEMSNPNMEIPIQLAMTYPEVFPTTVPDLDFFNLSKLSFEAPDYNKFRCLKIAVECAKAGGSAPVILNAANEMAVKLFLENAITFDKIPNILEDALSKFSSEKANSLDEILALDSKIRANMLK